VDSWDAPPLPRLPGDAVPPRVHDTPTDEVRPVDAGPIARMYVCGITPYDATHLGHAATYVAFDLLNRALRDAGHEVRYVQNVTDVDDPLLERATATGDDWQDLARRETDRFRSDMTALRVIPPEHYVGAVEAIPLVVALVQRLRASGQAYDVDGDVYFSVWSDERFGSVSGLGRDDMLEIFGERGGDPGRPGKKDPLDCLLWQAARPGEPSWESALGPGRPGWHIECAAIALEHLGMGFDVQGGGRDLVFPHHEMGSSEAAVVTGGWPYARRYVHTGMVGLDGEKMSKSKGNLVFVSQLREAGVHPMAIRLALLAHHYRDDWEWTDAGLREAQARLERWRTATSAASGPAAQGLLAEVRTALADDLDAPRALAAVDRWVEHQQAGGDDDPAAPGLVRVLVDALLGVALD
jgi:L-cysteine:1D-myo-inositol 2-amino-2-deoxy-alpha-D-glucopyranoside ligase